MSPCVVCVGVRDCNKKHMGKALNISGEAGISGRHVQSEKQNKTPAVRIYIGISHSVLNKFP